MFFIFVIAHIHANIHTQAIHTYINTHTDGELAARRRLTKFSQRGGQGPTGGPGRADERAGQEDGRGRGCSGGKVAFYQMGRVRRGLVEGRRGGGMLGGGANGMSAGGETAARVIGRDRDGKMKSKMKTT